jgi:nitroimidazol reductase NimA-like FMN-containing flavoprotein (pyridoxamine 5'-phosphate oxidase superfamily)
MAGMGQDERALVALSRRECLGLLRAETVGRVVFTERALPAVVPVTYTMVGEALVFATASGTRLAAAARGGVLAMEVDRLDPTSRTGWSVVVTGLPDWITDVREHARLSAALDTWAPGHHDLLLRLPTTVLTGRRILVESPAPTPTIG